MRKVGLLSLPILLIAFASSPPAATQQAYYAHCEHGGYFLTSESDFQKSLDAMFDLLDQNKSFKENLEIEPWTFEKMKGGAVFQCELSGRDQWTPVSWWLAGDGQYSVTVSGGSARTGAYGIHIVLQSGTYANACQGVSAAALAGQQLSFSGWIRQKSGSSAVLFIDAHQGGKAIPNSGGWTTSVPADGQWYFREVKYMVPAEAEVIFPTAVCSGAAEADFDDLSLEVVATGKETLKNGDFEKVGRYLQDQERLEKISGYLQNKKVEIVGGAYTQPFLFMLDNESALRQFSYGLKAVEDALGASVKIYAAQEMGMAGQLPQILKLFDFKGVLYRTSWGAGGMPSPVNFEKCLWAVRAGANIECVPAYLFTGWYLGQDSKPSLEYMAKAKSANIQNPLFSEIPDFMPSTLIKSGAPALKGEFGSGWANLYRQLPAGTAPGTTVTLSCLMRAYSEGVQLYIDSYDQNNVHLGSVVSPDVPVDGQWHTVTVAYPVKAAAAILFPQAKITAMEGKADIDLIQLKDAAGAVLAEESFEKGLGAFAVGFNTGVAATSAIVSGGAPHGEAYVRLTMESRVLATIVTLSEYFKLTGAASLPWNDAFRSFTPYFPCGFLSGSVQAADREAEDGLLRTERALALLGLNEQARLDDAWKLHLLGQHHDPWICAAGGAFGMWRQKTYEKMALEAQAEAGQKCEALLNDAGYRSQDGVDKVDGATFALLNLTGVKRKETTRVLLELPPGAVKTPVVVVDSKAVPASCKILASHADGTVKAVLAEFLAEIEGFSTAACRVQNGAAIPLPQISVSAAANAITVDNGLVRIEALTTGASVSAAGSAMRYPLKLAGYFPGKGSVEARLQFSAVAYDGATVVLSGAGAIEGTAYTCQARVSPLSPLVRLSLEFDFGAGTVIGMTADKPVPVPLWAYDEEKLRLSISLPFTKPEYFAHGPYEISSVAPKRWPIVRYAVAQENADGIAVMTDRVTNGVFLSSPASLAIVLAHGGRVVYSSSGENGIQPLSGKQRWELTLLPFRGDWRSAQIPTWRDKSSQPLLAVAGTMPPSRLVSCQPEEEAIVTGLFRVPGGLLIRLWRPYPGTENITVKVKGATSLSRADPYGNALSLLSGTNTATVKIVQEEIVTILAK